MSFGIFSRHWPSFHCTPVPAMFPVIISCLHGPRQPSIPSYNLELPHGCKVNNAIDACVNTRIHHHYKREYKQHGMISAAEIH